MAKHKLIGICGPARSGKDTTANFIVAANHGFYRYSFAEPLYRMAYACFGTDFRAEEWQGAAKETAIPAIGKSPRQILQTLGTEWGRELINQDLWTILARRKLMINGPGMVISDVRFENEAKFIRDLGGVVVHIRRDDAIKVNPHASEAGVQIDNGDFVILNNGTLEELQSKVEGIFGEFQT